MNTTLIHEHVYNAWKHAVRALNAAENAGKVDTHTKMTEIVAQLSQQLEYEDSTYVATAYPPAKSRKKDVK